MLKRDRGESKASTTELTSAALKTTMHQRESSNNGPSVFVWFWFFLNEDVQEQGSTFELLSTTGSFRKQSNKKDRFSSVSVGPKSAQITRNFWQKCHYKNTCFLNQVITSIIAPPAGEKLQPR